MIKDGSAFAEAYNFLRQRIRDGRLASGTKIRAEDIATELGISRMPVREAIRQLDSEGLVTIRPNRGAVVTKLDSEDILELFEMRAVLEGLAMKHAVSRLTQSDYDELELLLLRLGRATNDFDEWIVHHNRFHDAICTKGGSARLLESIQRLRTAVEPYLRLSLAVPRRDGIIDEHRRLLAALRSGDPDRAERAMRDHIQDTAIELGSFTR